MLTGTALRLSGLSRLSKSSCLNLRNGAGDGGVPLRLEAWVLASSAGGLMLALVSIMMNRCMDRGGAISKAPLFQWSCL